LFSKTAKPLKEYGDEASVKVITSGQWTDISSQWNKQHCP